PPERPGVDRPEAGARPPRLAQRRGARQLPRLDARRVRFFLVVFTLTAIGQEFGVSDKQKAVTLSTTLAFRPVGALVLGPMADRFGRRLPLMLSLVFFSLMEVLSGLAPTYTAFLVFRALFGIGMGG